MISNFSMTLTHIFSKFLCSFKSVSHVMQLYQDDLWVDTRFWAIRKESARRIGTLLLIWVQLLNCTFSCLDCLISVILQHLVGCDSLFDLPQQRQVLGKERSLRKENVIWTQQTRKHATYAIFIHLFLSK